MVAIAPHRPASPERAVNGFGESNREAAEPAAHDACVVGFDDQVHVIVLDSELQYPESVAGTECERTAERGEYPGRA